MGGQHLTTYQSLGLRIGSSGDLVAILQAEMFSSLAQNSSVELPARRATTTRRNVQEPGGSHMGTLEEMMPGLVSFVKCV
jgi:hypothetical protein